jgi:hypothetical protein
VAPCIHSYAPPPPRPLALQGLFRPFACIRPTGRTEDPVFVVDTMRSVQCTSVMHFTLLMLTAVVIVPYVPDPPNPLARTRSVGCLCYGQLCAAAS